MRTITIRAAIVALVVAGALAGRPGGLPIAAADLSLSISTTPALMPAFDPTIRDYTARCGTSATIAAPVTVTASAPTGSTVSIAGGVPATGAFSTTINRAWNESFAVTMQTGTAAPVNYFVRCVPADMPLVTAIRSGAPGAEYFMLSATRPTANHTAGAYSTRYLQIVNTQVCRCGGTTPASTSATPRCSRTATSLGSTAASRTGPPGPGAGSRRCLSPDRPR